MRKISVLFIFVIILSIMLSSCGDENISRIKQTTEPTAAPTTVSPYIINPLTGEQTLDKTKAGLRPVAIMVNNIYVAQSVQTGLDKADIVYETLVEGGITRLMAVYSDISKVKTIGTVRSARYSYAELACGLDAMYVHCGSDNKYCTPHMRELGLDDVDLMYNSSLCERIDNGKDYEHTLYTYGKRLAKELKGKRYKIKDRAKNVYNFNAGDVAYTDAATKFDVKFSYDYTSSFKYNKKTKKYVRFSDGEMRRDYFTNNSEQFKNVIVMFTDVYAFSDNHHMISELDSGKGYYITNGTFTEITWKKGKPSEPLKFYTSDGKELFLNRGNSYVCITGKEYKSNLWNEIKPTTTAAKTTK